jgi:hypothetical protein
MVGKVMEVIVPVEIVQDEKTAEAEASPPEWPGDPGIERTVAPRRWIIADDGRSVLVIVSFGGCRIFGNLRRRSAGAGLIFGT